MNYFIVYPTLGESSKFPKSWTLEILIFNIAGQPQNTEFMIENLHPWYYK